jgi:integrase
MTPARETLPLRVGQNKLGFTVAALNAIKPPTQGRLYVYDSRTSGLAMCVTVAGGRTFYVYRRVNGRPVRYKIGKFPAVSIEQARKATLDYCHDVDINGVSPQQLRQKDRAQPTLGDAWESYKAGTKRTAATTQSDGSRWGKWLNHLTSRRLSTITRTEIRTLHAKLGQESGETSANRVVQLLRRIYAHAIDAFDLDLDNPAKMAKGKFFPERQRERFLQSDELPRFFAAIETESDDTLKDFFALSLWTGGRRSNMLAMRWDEINLALRTWAIPPEKFKTGKKIGKGMTVTLAPQAVAILTRRRKADPASEWVFPGRGKTGHLVEPKLAWLRLLDRAGIKDLRLHDLRRTLGSWQAALGASLPIIGKSLGHCRPETTAIYARLNLDPVRESVNAAAAAIAAAAKKADDKEGA